MGLKGKELDTETVMSELRKLETKYEKKIHEYALDKLQFANTLANVSNTVTSLSNTTEKLSTAILGHMQDEETHHITVANALGKIEEALKAKPSAEDLQSVNVALERQRGRVNTIWVVGSSVVTVTLVGLMSIASYIKDDVVATTKEASKKEIHKKELPTLQVKTSKKGK